MREAEAGLLEAEEATRLTTDEHRSRLTGAEAEAQTADGRVIYDVYDVDAMRPSVAKTTTRSSLR